MIRVICDEHFSSQLCSGAHAHTAYNLRDRVYIGNTTMDPQLALIMANVARVGRGSHVLDPFAGTGGVLLAAAHYGAVCYGLEIDYNTAHARGKSSRINVEYRSEHESVRANFVQHGFAAQFAGYVVGDVSRMVGCFIQCSSASHDQLQTLWRPAMRFDAIVSDRELGGVVVIYDHKSSLWSTCQRARTFFASARDW